MQIVGEKEALADAGQAVLRVVAARATLPVLGGVRISAGREGVQLAGTDLEVFLTIDAGLEVEEQGAVVVPGRLFGDILRSLPAGKVVIRGHEGEVVIESGRSEFVLAGFPVADFPEITGPTGGMGCRAVGDELGQALRQVVRAASVDEARPVLTGVLWSLEGGVLRLVATDSYRLAVRELVVKEASGDGAAIVPGRALAEFGRHIAGGEADAVVQLGEAQAALVGGRVRVLTRLIEGEFPNYRQLIPDGYANHLVVETQPFADAVERVGLVAQASTPVRLHLGGEVQLTAREAGVGDAVEVVEKAHYEGEPMVVAFNPRFLRDGLEGVEAERTRVEVGDPAKPAVIRGEGRDDFSYLLMPVRLPG